MMKEKLELILNEIDSLNLSGVLLRNPENLLFATGYWSALGRSLLWVSSDGRTKLLAPKSEIDFVPDGCVDEVEWQADEGLDAIFSPYPGFKKFLGKLSGRVGVELSSEVTTSIHVGSEASYASAPTFDLVKQAGAELVDFTPSIEKLRQHKSEGDVEKIALSYEISAVGLREGRFKLSEGMTEAELASVIEGAINSSVGYKGAKRVRAFAFVMSGYKGETAYYPYDISSEKTIKRGESVLIELDVQVDGYWSDTTRTWFIDPPKEMRDRYEAVLEGNEAATKAAKIGAPVTEVDSAARKVISDRGYGKEFNHRLGHGVGFRHHEMPALHPASKDVLAKGMTFTIEPGVYGKGFGIRIENGVEATERGGRKLGDVPLGFP
ncbi:MAG: M24 family metallopeptidase [Thermoprotei archaeon]